MERLTDCAQGYCEMYCKKYMLCFEDPEDCIFKDEIKLYDAIKSIEGIVPFDRLLELACADKAGRLVVLPCKVGDTVYRVLTTRDCPPVISEVKIKTVGQAADLIGRMGKRKLLSYYLTREEAEAAVTKKGGANEDSGGL